MLRFCKKKFQSFNNPFTQKFHDYCKNISQNNNKTVLLV